MKTRPPKNECDCGNPRVPGDAQIRCQRCIDLEYFSVPFTAGVRKAPPRKRGQSLALISQRCDESLALRGLKP